MVVIGFTGEFKKRTSKYLVDSYRYLPCKEIKDIGKWLEKDYDVVMYFESPEDAECIRHLFGGIIISVSREVYPPGGFSSDYHVSVSGTEYEFYTHIDNIMAEL